MQTASVSDGFDHDRYREEVEQRWGETAYRSSDRWWRGLDEAGRRAFLDEAAAIGAAWQDARTSGLSVADHRVRDLAQRHIDWIAAGWGGRRPSAEQVIGLAQMYVTDERFAAAYGGVEGASYVRDSLVAYVT